MGVSSTSKSSSSTTSTTPSRAWTRLTAIATWLRRSSRPRRVTTPSRTSTSTLSGSTQSERTRTSWRTSAAISPSDRRNTLSRSARLTMPSSGPAGSTTGSRFTPCRCSSLAASATVASGPTVTAGLVISSAAVSPTALARSARRRRPSNSPPPAGPSGNSSFRSRSASDTIPTTRPSPSRTGRALTRRSASSSATCLKGASRSTVQTSVVITSRTRRRMASPFEMHPRQDRRPAEVAVVDVPGQPVLHPDHALDAVDGAEEVGEDAAPLDPALEHDHAVVDVDEEAVRVHGERADDHLVHDLAPDVLVGPVEHLQEVGAADDPGQPVLPVDHRQPLDPGGVQAPGRLGHGGVGRSTRRPRSSGRGRPRRPPCRLGPAAPGPDQGQVGVGVGGSSLSSRSASETTPSTRPSSSTTGSALTRCRISRATTSLYDVVGATVATSVVITSRTRLCMRTSLQMHTFGPPSP